QDVTQLPMFRRARLGMGYLSQEPSIFRKLTGEQNILAILEVMPQSRSLGRKLSRAERHQRAEEVLEQFGLTRLSRNSAARCVWRRRRVTPPGRPWGWDGRLREIPPSPIWEPLLAVLAEPFTGIDPH